MRKTRRRIRRWILGTRLPIAGAVLAIGIGVSASPAHAWTAADPTIAPGVKIGVVDVGGLDRARASAAVTAAYSAPVTIGVGTTKLRPAVATLGQQLALEDALTAAFAVGRNGTPPPASTAVSLEITVKRAKLMEWLDATSKAFNMAPRNASTRLQGRRVRVMTHAYGRELRRTTLRNAVAAAVVQPNAAHALGARPDLVKMLAPSVTSAMLPPVLVVDRSNRELTYWSPHRRGATYKIAVGQPSYPTPLGHFSVVSRQVNPWWNPPNSDWAKGEEPIPPGPDNPLGTRWIGLSASGVGIHGTPNEGSVGTAASHGCMRMRKREVEWLFRRVRVGSPVYILR